MTFTFFLFFFLFTTPCTAKQMNILVHPFENTGDKEYSWISAGMTDTVISDLTRIQNISVVSNQDRKKILEEVKFIFSGLAEEDKMIKLGKLTGANVIFTGSYLVSGPRIRVHARLVNVETGKVESSTKIDGTLYGIFDLQDKVVFTLMGESEKITIADIKPVNLTEQDRKKIAEKPKPKLTAYEWYAKGLEVRETNPKEALTNFKKALDIDPNYTDALMNTGYIAGNTLNLFSEALGYLEKAKRIFNSRNDTKSADYALLMMNIGVVYHSKGQLDRALEYYLNSQTIIDSLRLQNTTNYAALMMNIGIVYDDKGQPDRALEYYLKDKSIADRLGLQNTSGYAVLMNNIGVIYRDKGQLDRALEYYLSSQSIYDRLGLQNTAGYTNLMTCIGVYYADKVQLDRAMEYFLNSQTIKDMLGLQNTADYAGLMNNIGGVYASKGQLDCALEYYLKDKSIEDRLGLQNTASYAMTMNNMALLYEKQGQRDMAGRYYRMAYDTFVRSDYSGKVRDMALSNARRLGY
ncbi:MAG: tetratricopeptide repeat protein [Syntrophus sp. (in: bacteria)]